MHFTIGNMFNSEREKRIKRKRREKTATTAYAITLQRIIRLI